VKPFRTNKRAVYIYASHVSTKDFAAAGLVFPYSAAVVRKLFEKMEKWPGPDRSFRRNISLVGLEELLSIFTCEEFTRSKTPS
jgi:hypothetical protein